MQAAVQGIAEACRVLEVPVVSGNVSLYNESRGQAIFPTPVVGGLGLLQDVKAHCRSGFKDEKMVVALLGVDRLGVRASDLAGSEYLRPYLGMGGAMSVDW